MLDITTIRRPLFIDNMTSFIFWLPGEIFGASFVSKMVVYRVKYERWGEPMPTEADICRMYVTPKLRVAGWTDEQIREQVTLTHGRIVPTGGFLFGDGIVAKIKAQLLWEAQSTGGG